MRARNSRGVGAVEDPVIADQRDGHDVARDDLAVADHRARLHLAHREDRGLRRVDDGAELGDAEHAEVRDRERPARELGRGDGVGPHALGQGARVARDLAQRLLVGVEHRRHDERVVGGDGDADVDARVELEAAVLVGAVGARVLAQRQRRRLDDHVVVGRHRAAQRLGRGLELLAQGDGALHVDVGGDGELGDGRLGLRHPPRDDLLGARELLDADVALGGAGLGDARGRRRGARGRCGLRARPRRRGRRGGRGLAAGAGAACAAPGAAPDAAASTSAFTIRPPGPVPCRRGEVDALLARDAPRDRRCLRRARRCPPAKARPPAARRRGLRRRRGRLGRGGRRGRGRRLARRAVARRLGLLGRLGLRAVAGRRLAAGADARDDLADGQRVALLGDDRQRARRCRPRRSSWPCRSRSRRARRRGRPRPPRP